MQLALVKTLVNLRSSFELSKLPYHIGAAIIVEAYGTTACHCAPHSAPA